MSTVTDLEPEQLQRQLYDYNRTYLLTLQCTNPECMIRTRIGRVLRPHPVSPAPFMYCPVCGRPSVLASSDSEETYWEALARSHSVTVELIKLIYDSWDPHEYYRFSDYMTSLREPDSQSDTDTDPDPDPQP